ncbi:MAG: sulfite exporter TauE/SafE family protein [Candidatus Diapherotrites archaeon]|nr:sulfite exporter TauE/SafE family protein [Candidatus Diapherotrites archaeon]
MFIYLQYVLLFLVGLVGSFYGSMVGGLSLISIPALLFTGLSPLTAIATNLVVQIAPGLVAVLSYNKHGKLKIGPVLYLLVPFIVGALIGAYVIVSLDDTILRLAIATFLFLGVILMLLREHINLSFIGKNRALESLVLTAVGAYKSIFGASAKTLTIMILAAGSGMGAIEASAAASFLILFSVITGSAYFIMDGIISWPHWLAMSAGCSIGAFLGTQTAVKKGNEFVEKLLILVALAAAVKLLV